jgi:hypothetical protein
MENCSHYWIPQINEKGMPDFRMNRQMSDKYLIHVTCENCNCRTWFTKEQWDNIPITEDPRRK